MKLAQLKDLAKQMGLRGTSTMRKPDLIETINAARTGGQAPEGVTVGVIRRGRPPKVTKAEKAAASKASSAKKASEEAPAASEEPKAAAPSAEKSTQPQSSRSKTVAGASAAPLMTEPVLTPAPKATRTRSASTSHRKNEGIEKLDLGIDIPSRSASTRASSARSDEQAHENSAGAAGLDDILAVLPDRSGQGHASKRSESANRDSESNEGERDFTRRSRNNRHDREDRNERGGRNDRRNKNSRNDRNDRRNNRNDRHDREDRNERDYEDRNDRDNESNQNSNYRDEGQAQQVVPVAGIVDILDSYAFIRTSGYLPGPNDVYVSMGLVKKYGLRKGDAVQGTIRPPRENDRRSQRQKFVPLQSIESVNGMSIDDARQRPEFNKLTPLYPQERLRMETEPNKITGRLIDIVSPIGKGQRGLIVSPPKAGKTITLQQIANSISTNNPEVHLMVVLVDERPEEVTDMERTVQGEVISSTFDRPATDHTIVAELAIERAKRLVELGQDVVVLLDSMTRLARAYNIAAPASGRILSGGVDAQALYPPKKFFGAARNIENGGSLTIISSALVETGSKMDEVIFEEFKGTGNMELRLSRELADKRLFPAIDINASGTRREELITPPTELAVVYRLRRAFGGLEPEQAYQTLVPRLKKTRTNREFLAAINSTMPQGN
jgi:transcription termination factor Rho